MWIEVANLSLLRAYFQAQEHLKTWNKKSRNISLLTNPYDLLYCLFMVYPGS